ncbi:uncharacterized protein B0H64DRAFT_82533 [Chaetomium fimeti]|uniref:Uncharacterized protein n=1 Tax=Chaetomium fimeti TaxID=1854472 RepID=A0AAE0HLJ3_9PEZI|nr:hypothetical protein B0H64DRAFT_82533 [Chaetomium fimeti]
MSSSHSENTPASEHQAPEPPAAEPSHPSDDTHEARREGGYGPTPEQIATAQAILAKMEADGWIKPFVIRYPRWVLDDGTVICEGSGPEAEVEAATASSNEGPAPTEGPGSDNVRARL